MTAKHTKSVVSNVPLVRLMDNSRKVCTVQRGTIETARLIARRLEDD